jgi:hypothetical protein
MRGIIMSDSMDTFNRMFAIDVKEVPYSESWSNGTGYLDGATIDQELWNTVELGEVVKSIDPHGRKILLLKTFHGICAVFQRYAGGDRGVVVHSTIAADGAIMPTAKSLSSADLQHIFGFAFSKFGETLPIRMNDSGYVLAPQIIPEIMH